MKFKRKRHPTTDCGRVCIFLQRFGTNDFLHKHESVKFQENNYDNSFEFFTKMFLFVSKWFVDNPPSGD